MADTLIAVLDVGKTMAKLTLWTRAGALIARQTRANVVHHADGYRALNVAAIEEWLAAALAGFAGYGRLGAIILVGHGAAAALVRDGRLVAAPIDYETAMPAADRAAYDADRAPFAETGSPALPDGLNLGAQLHWLERLRPESFRNAQVLLWPQFWAWRLCGVAASEVTSLGCHTDLWNPAAGTFSSLAERRGWAAKFPPLRAAAAPLGTVTREWQGRCGLPDDVVVHCGIHDSNAALVAARGFPELSGREATILSTGTWFVAMRTPGRDTFFDPAWLPEGRDCLVNVDHAGRPVPSARFMGGREIEQLIGLDTRRIDIGLDQPVLLAAVPGVLAAGIRLLPTFAPGFGPFAGQRGRWIGEPTDDFARRAAVSLYAALVADTSLDLIGSRKQIVVEGRFAEAEVFVRALAALRPDTTIYRANAHNDVSFGALRLLDPTLRPAAALEPVAPLDGDLAGYRVRWRHDVAGMEQAA